MLTPENIDEICRWEIDAFAEKNANYIYFDSERISGIKSGRYFLVVGRKGTGKTAICRFLLNDQAINSTSSCVTYLTYNDCIMPFVERIRAIGYDFTSMLRCQVYWKLIIYSSVLVQSKFKTIWAKHKIMKAIMYALFPDISDKKIEVKVQAGLNTGIFKFGVDITTAKNKENWNIDRIVSFIETYYASHISEFKDNYVLFDRLDYEYIGTVESHDDRRQYLNLLNSLISVCYDINQGIATTWKLNCVVFLREDIYAMIKNDDKDKWGNKKIDLVWSLLAMENLLKHRLVTALHGYDANNVFQQVFAQNVSFGSICRCTQLRPRDLIQYMILLADNLKTLGKNLIEKGHVKYVQSNYAGKLFESLEIEAANGEYYSEISAILRNLHRLPKKTSEYSDITGFSVEDFMACFPEQCTSEEIAYNLIGELFKYNFIGQIFPSFALYIYMRDSKSRFTTEKRDMYCIHYGLLEYVYK